MTLELNELNDFLDVGIGILNTQMVSQFCGTSNQFNSSP